MLIINLLFFIVSYLIGSIPSGVVIGKYLYHKDIRRYGSGNIGTTNAFRAFGTLGGLLVFVCDMAKGLVPTLLGRWLPFLSWDPLFFGAAAIVGHVFPIFLQFKGGKAVATSFGFALAYVPWFALAAIASFFIVLLFSRMVSLSSILALTFASLMATVIPGYSWYFRLLVYAVTILIYIRHTDNIKRILNGTERKIGERKHHNVK